MLLSFRERLKSVGSGLVSGLYGRTDGGRPLTGVEEPALTAGGAELLVHYQNSWEQLNLAGEHSASRAAAVDAHVRGLQQGCCIDLEQLQQLGREVDSLEGVSARVERLATFSDQILSECHQLLQAVHAAEAGRRAAELDRRRALEEARLIAYTEGRHRQLEEVKVTLCREQEHRLKEMRQRQTERHDTFETLSQGEIEEFRSHQQLARTRLGSCRSQYGSLEDVDISTEVGTEELNDFLADT